MSDQFDDTILELLAHSRRRRVCETLSAADREYLPIERLAERVVEREAEAESGQTTDRVERVTIELYHVHLPKLDDAGLVSFDDEMQAVAYEGHPIVERVAEKAWQTESAATRESEDE